MKTGQEPSFDHNPRALNGVRRFPEFAKTDRPRRCVRVRFQGGEISGQVADSKRLGPVGVRGPSEKTERRQEKRERFRSIHGRASLGASAPFRRRGGIGQADRGRTGGGRRGDDPRGILIPQGVVGDEQNAQRPTFE